MDSFRKPFRAVPIQLGEEYRARRQREQRRRLIGTTAMMALVAVTVFIIGMIATNFATVSRHFLPTGLLDATTGDRPVYLYFPNCSAARATGHVPIRAGSPGYRIGLDADGDGIACEPYIDP